MVDRHNPSQARAKQCQLVTVTHPANLELEHAAQNAKKRCPVTLANNVPTAKVGNDNLVAAWGDAKVASDVPKTWNPAAVGNILGKSATPTIAANVPMNDGAKPIQRVQTGWAC